MISRAEQIEVVADVKQYGLDTPGTMALYVPMTQMPTSAMTLVLRSQAEPLQLIAAIRREIAAIEIYGVLAQSVAQRTHEIGIRMALGAQTQDLLKLIVGHGLALTALGIATGVSGAFVCTRLIASLLFGIGSNDPATFFAISALVLLVAFLACYLPARRATKLNPMIALTK